MKGFSSVDLQEIEEERERAAARFEKALSDARVIGNILNDIHGTRHSERFWLYLVLPLVRKHQIRMYQQGLSAQRKAAEETPERAEQKPIARRMAGLKSVMYSKAKMALKSAAAWSRYPELKKKLAVGRVFSYAFHEPPALEGEAVSLPAAVPALFGKGDQRKRSAVLERSEPLSDGEQRAVLCSLPDYLVERFDGFIRRVPLTNPAEKEFHISIGHVDFMALVFALHFEHGAKMIRYQHGSHYGEQAYFDSVERHNCTEFHTWGWKILPQDVPDRAFRLEGFRRRYQACGTRREIDLLMCFPALHENNIERVSAQAHCILDGLNRTRFRTVIARPRPMARFGDFSHSVRFLSGRDIEIDSGQDDIAALIAKSELVLHFEVPSTTFLECMHVDQPVTGIYFNLRPTEIVLPFYQFFFRVGILHLTAESLVEHLNSISDVASWWSDVRGHAEYQEFKAKFCGQSSDGGVK